MTDAPAMPGRMPGRMPQRCPDALHATYATQLTRRIQDQEENPHVPNAAGPVESGGSLRIGSLFSGVGGLDMGVQSVIGGQVVWHVEFDPAPSKVLAHHWPDVPNYGDITTVDWSTVEPVEVLTGGFPCQDLSLAGRRAGMHDGTRSGLWAYYLKAIDALRPRMAVIENVRGLLSGCAESDADSDLGPCPRCADPGSGSVHSPNVRALGRVLLDLASVGYDAEWVGVSASDAGAPHGRFRVFVVAYPSGVSGGVWYGDDVSVGWGTVGRAPSTGGSAAQDPNLAVGDKRGFATPGQAESGWARADLGGRGGTPVRGSTTPDTDFGGFGRVWRVEPEQRDLDGRGSADIAWGDYEPAIRRWESVTGRHAPAPTVPDGRNGNHRLNSAFVEWMMGLPAGHVTDPAIGLSRSEQLKALGNGVVPQQAAMALRMLAVVV